MGSRLVSAKCIGALVGASLALMAGNAFAQAQSNNQVASKTDWSVFEDNNPRECWAVTTFKESVNTRDGRVVAVRRSDILFMVFFRPDAKVKGQVGFTGGYPFAGGSTVTMDVDGNRYDLFTEGEWAWPASAADDGKIITAMKRGSKAVLSARSARGTKTQDTFSLLGFTAAYEEAEKRCS